MISFKAPREFENPLADPAPLAGIMSAGRGGALAMADGVPQLRDVRPGRPAAGRGWIGLTPRGAYETRDLRRRPLFPVWLALALVAGLLLAGWLREGRG